MISNTIYSKGRDNFKDYTFSAREWSAPTMVSPKEIRERIDSFALCGRKIKRMRIGMLRRKLGGFAASISRPLFQLTAGGGLIQPALLGMLRYGWDGFAVQKTGLLFSSAVGAILAQPAQLGIILCSLDIFVT